VSPIKLGQRLDGAAGAATPVVREHLVGDLADELEKTLQRRITNSWPCSPEDLKKPRSAGRQGSVLVLRTIQLAACSEESLASLQKRILREM
jgi:hypothetical protein